MQEVILKKSINMQLKHEISLHITQSLFHIYKSDLTNPSSENDHSDALIFILIMVRTKGLRAICGCSQAFSPCKARIITHQQAVQASNIFCYTELSLENCLGYIIF